MGRKKGRRSQSFASRLRRIVVFNLVPLVGLGALLWGVATDRIDLDALPRGLDRNLIHLGVLIGFLFLTVGLVLPFSHALASAARRRLKLSQVMRSEGGVVRLVWESILWLPLTLFHGVFATLRFAGYILAFGLIGVSLLLIARFFQPDLLEAQLHLNDWFARAETWLRSLGP